jgi:hypothetical protein
VVFGHPEEPLFAPAAGTIDQHPLAKTVDCRRCQHNAVGTEKQCWRASNTGQLARNRVPGAHTGRGWVTSWRGVAEKVDSQLIGNS